MNMLEVCDLSVSFPTQDGLVKAVNTIDLSVDEGEVLGILGESGSGKSVFGSAILRLIKDRAEIGGQVIFKGDNLLTMAEKDFRKMRGRQMGVIMQNPGSSLNPSLTIGYQVEEAIAVHEKSDKSSRKKKALELIEKVRIKQPQIRAREYPHQYSGGMKERAVIAMGIAQSPEFLIADEPTKGLDTLVKFQIVQLLKEVARDKTMLVITHDLSVAREVCGRIGILYLGEFVEICPAEPLFLKQCHPYTEGFFKSMPENGMIPIGGAPGSLIDLPEGCRFHPRCSNCMERCRKEHPPMYQLEDGRQVRCFLYAGD